MKSDSLFVIYADMKKRREDYGTDPRFPVWSGGTVAGNLFRSGMTIAVLVNWATIYILFVNILVGYPDIVWDVASVLWSAMAIGTCLLTMRLINHKDAFTQNCARTIACGVPLILMLSMLFNSFTI